MENVKRKKYGGRKKGMPNKKQAFVVAFCKHMTSGGIEKFKEEFNNLSGKDYVDCFIQLSKITQSRGSEHSEVYANEFLIESLNSIIKNNKP